MVPPAEFIPLAEETGLIVPIGEWVLRRPAATPRTWPDDIRVAVNLSPVQFRARRWSQIGDQRPRSARGLRPTGSSWKSPSPCCWRTAPATLGDAARSCAQLGVQHRDGRFRHRLFGAELSARFPFDKIKIDQSFVKDVTDRQIRLSIVRAVTGLAAASGMSTTAEGVETREQLDRLRDTGCTHVQGYYLGGRCRLTRCSRCCTAGAPTFASPATPRLAPAIPAQQDHVPPVSGD